MPTSRPLMLEDFEAIRRAADDGHREALTDGSLIVTPSPLRKHQGAVTRLALLLAESHPEPTLEVLLAPLDIRLNDTRVVQPDVVVLLGPDRSTVGSATLRAPLVSCSELSRPEDTDPARR